MHTGTNAIRMVPSSLVFIFVKDVQELVSNSLCLPCSHAVEYFGHWMKT